MRPGGLAVVGVAASNLLMSLYYFRARPLTIEDVMTCVETLVADHLTAIDHLARHLHWTIDRLDPGEDDPDWDHLSET